MLIVSWSIAYSYIIIAQFVNCQSICSLLMIISQFVNCQSICSFLIHDCSICQSPVNSLPPHLSSMFNSSIISWFIAYSSSWHNLSIVSQIIIDSYIILAFQLVSWSVCLKPTHHCAICQLSVDSYLPHLSSLLHSSILLVYSFAIVNPSVDPSSPLISQFINWSILLTHYPSLVNLSVDPSSWHIYHYRSICLLNHPAHSFFIIGQ